MALNDYQGTQYDPGTLFALQQQILKNLDVNNLRGEAWKEAGQNIGFDYGQANQAFQSMFGRPMTIADQIALDMARNLSQRGITDLSQITNKDVSGGVAIEPVMDQAGNITGYKAGDKTLTPEEVSQYVQPHMLGDNLSYGYLPNQDKQGSYLAGPDGQRIQQGIYNTSGIPDSTQFGGTYTGKGGTFYGMVPDGQGGYKFSTVGADTSDFTKDDALGVLSVLGIAGGGQLGLFGNGAAAAPTSFGVVDTAAANSILANAGAAGAAGAGTAAMGAGAAPTTFGIVDTAAADSILANAAGAGGLGGASYGTLGAGYSPGALSLGQINGGFVPSYATTAEGASLASGAGMGSLQGFGGATGALAGVASPLTYGGQAIPGTGIDFNAGAAGSASSGGGSGGGSGGSSMLDGVKDYLGPLSTLGGALLGSQGQQATASTSKDLPAFLQGPITQDLIPKVQGLLGSQMPAAQQAGQSMMTAGTGLLNRPVAGNGYDSVQRFDPGNSYNAVTRFDPGNLYGSVKLERPDAFTNPFVNNMANDIQRRVNETLAQNNQAIAGNSVATGGLGGSRQGVAQGLAASKAADYLAGQTANLYGQAYDADMNRALSKYGTDVGFATAQRGQDLSRTGLEMGFSNTQRGLDLQRTGQEQQFYGQQRGMDLTQAGVGQGLLSSGLDTQWSPLKSAMSIYSPMLGNGTTTATQSQGGGLGGAIGGALAGAQLGRNFGWW